MGKAKPARTNLMHCKLPSALKIKLNRRTIRAYLDRME